MSEMTALERSVHTQVRPHGGPGAATVYAVSGEHGAITLATYGSGLPWGPIGIHSLRPDFEGARAGECEFAPGGQCYADAGYRGGEKAYEILIARGTEALWAELEDWYHSRFEPATSPDDIACGQADEDGQEG